ncbi:hypothetical protein LSTR_LSTR014685, partial [Laodelphax striatellus]
MTVLWEGPNEPPRKRVCLSSSNSRRNVKRQRSTQQLSLANASSSVSSDCQASPLNSGVMMNGYGLSDSLHHHQHGLKNCSQSPDEQSPGSDSHSPIATLCNLGNTCFSTVCSTRCALRPPSCTTCTTWPRISNSTAADTRSSRQSLHPLGRSMGALVRCGIAA